MLRIVTHIERLLLVHDCVIVPKFGGFVLQTIPSVHGVEEHTFRPMAKEIVFNMTLQHTDGLLSSSYMQMYDVDYKTAQQLLEEDVDQLNVVLQEQKKISLGMIGTFVLGDEGQIIYSPGEIDLFNVGSYGLPMFHFPALQSVSAKQEEVALLIDRKKKDTLYIPINRKLIRLVGASVAAVALFLLVSTPVKDVNQSAYTASFIPSEMISYGTLAEASSTVETSEVVLLPEDELVEMEPVVIETKAVETEAVKAKPVLSAKAYHIVIASFPTENQADDYMSKVDRTICARVSKVARDGKYRIYADKFDNREQAERYLATLRKTDKYKDSWLFISR